MPLTFLFIISYTPKIFLMVLGRKSLCEGKPDAGVRKSLSNFDVLGKTSKWAGVGYNVMFYFTPSMDNFMFYPKTSKISNNM